MSSESNPKESDSHDVDQRTQQDAMKQISEMMMNMIKEALEKESEETKAIVEFSDNFAGIVFGIMQMTSMGVISTRNAIDMISLFYHLDTGKYLHHTKFSELVMHEKCIKYAKKMEENTISYNRRTEKFKLNQTLNDIFGEAVDDAQ